MRLFLLLLGSKHGQRRIHILLEQLDKEGKTTRTFKHIQQTFVQSLLLLLQIVRPVSAFIIVDVQNDFISGTLSISNCPAGQNGEEVRRKN